MELPLWGDRVGVGSGGAAGSSGRGHPWLIWRKPAICWAHGEPSSAEVPPPGKWSFKGWCLPASSFMGKLQGRDVQTNLILGLEETGCQSQSRTQVALSAPRPRPPGEQASLHVSPVDPTKTALCSPSCSAGHTMCPFTPGGSGGAWRPPWGVPGRAAGPTLPCSWFGSSRHCHFQLPSGELLRPDIHVGHVSFTLKVKAYKPVPVHPLPKGGGTVTPIKSWLL